MGRSGNQRWLRLAILGLLGFGSMSVIAAPPSAQRASFHLNLHPPVSALVIPENTAASFPSSLHHQSFGAQQQLQLPNLGAESTQGRIPGRAEEFAQRVRREGLPIARLWENKSALVSLGLNQRGKPGLWFVQKMH
jgi:hypothetical protein